MKPEISLWDVISHHWQNYLYLWMNDPLGAIFGHLLTLCVVLFCITVVFHDAGETYYTGNGGRSGWAKGKGGRR